MDSYNFENAGYLTRERLCGSSRTRLTNSCNSDDEYGVSDPNKIRGLYFNYLLAYSVNEQEYSWEEIGKALNHDSIFNVFVDKVLGFKKIKSWRMVVSFSPKEGEILDNLRKPLFYYTKESVKKALSATPELATYLTENYFYYKNKKISAWYFSNHSSLCIYHENIGSNYPESMEQEDSETLFSYARLISAQIRAISLDTSKLVKKPKEEPLLPKWLENTLKIGAKVGVKYLCASIGAKIDLPDWGGDNSNNIPDFDGDIIFDGNVDIDGDFDFNGGVDFDGDIDIDNDNDIDISSVFDGIAFQGKHFNGYEDLHKSISVPVMGGGGNSTLYVYKKLGSSAIYVSDGSCYPVSIAGHSWITVGSHKFDVSKIKSKL